MLWSIVLALLKVVVIVLGVYMSLAAFMVWGERKWSSLAQNRIGPNRAFVPFLGQKITLNGLVQVVADSIKMLFKEDVIIKNMTPVLSVLAPMIAFIIVFIAVPVIIPFTGEVDLGYYKEIPLFDRIDLSRFSLQVANPNAGLLYIFAIAALAPYASILAGWVSDSKYALLGSMRTSSQVISYEIALGISLVGLFMIAGSLRPIDLVEMQTGTLFGFLPRWGIFLQPLAFFLFFAAAYAETKRAPFDIPEGESEIVAGYFIEYSGMKFGLFYLSEFAEQVMMAAMLVTLFLGGYHFPYMTNAAYRTIATAFITGLGFAFFFLFAVSVLRSKLYGVLTWGGAFAAFIFGFAVGGWLNGNLLALVQGAQWQTALFSAASDNAPFSLAPALAKLLAQSLTFMVKFIITIWFLVIIRWSYPRFRYDQVMRLGWKILLPLALLNVFITGIVILFV